MKTPEWVLLLSFWLHMLATVLWIGSLAALSVVVLPAARRNLREEGYAKLLDGLQRRLDPLGWLSLAVLVVTGLIQMSANPNYLGFLDFGNNWARAILVKHLVFLAMTGVSAYLTWGLMPALQRNALLQARGKGAAEAEGLRRRETGLLRLNLALGMVVLLLTALARVA